MAEALGLPESPAKGAVVASDAFFPFADGLLTAAEAGATAVIQPGGSMRDDEVIAAADEAGLAMVFTGMRHFRHCDFSPSELSKIAVLHWAGLLERGVIEVFPALPGVHPRLQHGHQLRPLVRRAGGHALGSGGHRAGDLGMALVVGAHRADSAHRADLGRVGHRRGAGQRAGPRAGRGRRRFSEHVVLRDRRTPLPSTSPMSASWRAPSVC
jgi:hypothetical protein